MTSQCSIKNKEVQTECGCTGHSAKTFMTLIAIFGAIGFTGHYFFGWF